LATSQKGARFLDLLPPKISHPQLFGLLVEILSLRGPEVNAQLRVRLIKSGLPWQALLDLADGYDVLPPLIWSLIQRSLLLPVPAVDTNSRGAQHPTPQLLDIYRQHLVRRQRQYDQLVRVVRALNRVSVEPLLLKGAYYLFTPPGHWYEARDMRDLDLLVHPTNADRAIAALQGEGYRCDQRPIPMDQHLPEMYRDGEPSVVEIHTEALSFSARKLLTTEEVWRHARHLANDNGKFYVLPIEWQLLHGVLNHQVADRHFAQRMLALKPLWELARLAVGVTGPAWKTIGDLLASRGQQEVVATCIVQAMRLFDMPCPPEIKISPGAYVDADMVFKNAAAPAWLRHCRRLFDQLRFGFARETLAVRYGANTKFPIGAMVRHLRFLVRHYRGRIFLRLFGQRGTGS
jgi:hypothetical protein